MSTLTSANHSQLEILREQGEFVTALALLPSIITEYQMQKNIAGIAEALQGAALCYKHLFWDTGDQLYAHIAHHHASASFDIATSRGLSLTFCHFNLGETYMLLGDYPHAIEHYTKSLELYGDGPRIGNIRYHLGEAYHRVGERDKALLLMLQGLHEIQEKAYALDEFVAHVWESGCYLRLYELEQGHAAPAQLKEDLNAAARIIDSDPRLVLRKRQLKKMGDLYAAHL